MIVIIRKLHSSYIHNYDAQHIAADTCVQVICYEHFANLSKHIGI
jgi:hypothetical protein